MSTEIRIAGVGSQGLVTASIILAEALGIVRDFEVIQTQFYASNIQGGSSCGDVIFGREKIIFPWVMKPDFLVALAQDGIRTHGAAMRPGSTVLAVEGWLVCVQSSERVAVNESDAFHRNLARATC